MWRQGSLGAPTELSFVFGFHADEKLLMFPLSKNQQGPVNNWFHVLGHSKNPYFFFFFFGSWKEHREVGMQKPSLLPHVVFTTHAPSSVLPKSYRRHVSDSLPSAPTSVP